MFKQTLITLIAFLTIAAAINANFEDNIFYVELENRLSYKMFQTRGGIIAQDVDSSGNSELYMLINLQTKNTSVILSDIVNACNAKVGNFNKLHYHATTSTLVYYCMQNNSLLLIDDSSYTVDLVIPTNVNTVFDEVKLIPQGYSIAVLGMIGLFAETPGTSELITIDLQAKTVASHVVFNNGLNSGEAVVGYAASSNNLLYILTSTYTGTNQNRTTDYQVAVYSMFLIGNSYTLNNLTSMSFHYNNYPIISELYSVGNLLVVSYNKTVDIMTQQGNVLGSLEHLAVKAPLDVGYIAHVALAVEYGNSEFYALLHNKTLFKFTVQNGGYNLETFATGIQDMQYVTSNLTSNSLLFTIDELDLFNITDLQTSQTIYTTITGATIFMVSDTTYAVVGQPDQYVAYVFNRNTNLLIFQTKIGYNYFYDEDAHLISYMDHTSDRTQCQMVQFNIQTTNSYVPFTLDPSYGTDCHSYHFINVTNNLDNPQFLLNVWGKLLILSENFGLVNYGDFESDDFTIPFVDYDTLTVYRAVAKIKFDNEVKIHVYTYNSNNSTFTLQNTTQVEQFSVYSLYPAPGQLMIMGLFEFEFVDVSATFNKNVVKYSGPMGNISFFQDKNGVVYMILGYFDVYDGNQVTTLPGITDSTRTSHAAGQCRYTLVDQVNDLTMIRFYNVCPQGVLLSHIYA